MRATRLVSLLLLLQTRGQLTAAEIAERLDVSVRTVHRDVESLAAAGVPVDAVRGPAGGYRLAGGYRTRLTGLTADEAEALFAAGMPGPAAELGLGGELAAARLKLLAALPHELQERATRASRLFHLDTRGWFRAEDTVPHLPALAAAVWQGCRARIRYREKGNARPAHDRSAGSRAEGRRLVPRRASLGRYARLPRLARRRPCARSRRASSDPTEFELAAFWEQWSRSFEETLPRVQVTVRVADDVRRWLPGEPRIDEDGRAVVAFAHLGDAYRELLRFGSQVEVLEPAELRERIAATSREVAAMYGR